MIEHMFVALDERDGNDKEHWDFGSDIIGFTCFTCCMLCESPAGSGTERHPAQREAKSC